MKLYIAIIWSIVFVSDLICCLLGEAPTWVSVFLPSYCRNH